MLIFQSKIVYLGYELNSDGIRPVHDKVKAIRDVQQPRCVANLKSWLGMITFYSHFIPNLSSRFRPLYDLLKHDNDWNWTEECEQAFQHTKKILASDRLLIHYDQFT
ncbi:Uncharacterised protein at_DN1996 [Pycnogonum litorale]